MKEMVATPWSEEDSRATRNVIPPGALNPARDKKKKTATSTSSPFWNRTPLAPSNFSSAARHQTLPLSPPLEVTGLLLSHTWTACAGTAWATTTKSPPDGMRTRENDDPQRKQLLSKEVTTLCG